MFGLGTNHVRLTLLPLVKAAVWIRKGFNNIYSSIVSVSFCLLSFLEKRMIYIFNVYDFGVFATLYNIRTVQGINNSTHPSMIFQPFA